ncbi:MAG TPA: hypothetical protein VFE14_04310, partial [Micromonosporaceae bacterium]|nr:hypothetical protein [Micromonosporaceae bacterium]
MAGRMDNRQRAGWRVGIAIVAALALLGSDLVAFALPARAASTAPSGPAPEPSVAGRPVPKVEPVVGAEDTARATPPRPAPSWPAAGAAEVDLSDPGGVRQAGSLPVRVGRAAASRMGAPARVRVEVLDADAVSSLGGVGLAARVSRVDGVTTAARARVVLDYSGFAGAFDASFADRLRVVRLPGCVLDGAPKAADGCPLRTERVAAVNDFAAGTLTVDTDVTSTNTAVLMVESSSSGSFSGNFGATDLQASGRWQVGLSAGAFSYSYPVPEPPSVAGTGPNLSFGYNSAAVDGMTAASNAQSGWTGLGWTMGPGFIERRYKPCADDATGTGKKADQKNWGHLCWESPDENDGQVETTDPTNSDLTLSMEGRSSKIVKDRLTGGWKTEEDFGWRIEYLTGGASGQPYWRVTTQNGDVHRFGSRRDSEWQVPYAGDDPGEPCNSQYNSGGTTWPGMCQAPWRWNLDQVVDANENVTTLYWKREASQYRWYAREICCSVPPSYEFVPIGYDRGGYLDYVEWGANTAVAGSLPTSKMVFNMVSRCSDTTTRDDPLTNPYPIDTGTGNLTCKALLPPYVFWDVPNDLMTCTTTKCPSGSPAFFIVRRLDSIVTYSYDPTNAGWDDVSKLQLRFKYVQSPDNGSNGCCTPALWLDYVRPVGLAGTGEIRLPPTSFDAIALNGRVDYGSDGFFTAPRAILPRIGWVHNGFGGRVDITYGRANPCPDGGVSAAGYSTWYNSVQWDRGTDDCFRTYDFWFPGSFGSPATVHYGVYHKYLVTQVVSRDVVAGSPDMVT